MFSERRAAIPFFCIQMDKQQLRQCAPVNQSGLNGWPRQCEMWISRARNGKNGLLRRRGRQASPSNGRAAFIPLLRQRRVLAWQSGAPLHRDGFGQRAALAGVMRSTSALRPLVLRDVPVALGKRPLRHERRRSGAAQAIRRPTRQTAGRSGERPLSGRRGEAGDQTRQNLQMQRPAPCA